MVQAALLLIAALLPMLGGCASAWERNYRPSRQLAGTAVPATQGARVIEVEWERLADYAADARARSIARDVPPDRLDPAVLRDEVGRMLHALRIDAEPESAVLLGTSRFVSTDALDPFSGELAGLAASRGGDVVVFSVEPRGLRETIEYATRSAWYDDEVFYRTRSGKRRSRTQLRRFEEQVPVVVQRESWLYSAFVFRLGDSDEIERYTRGRPWID